MWNMVSLIKSCIGLIFSARLSGMLCPIMSQTKQPMLEPQEWGIPALETSKTLF